MEALPPGSLIPMDAFTAHAPVSVDVVYAQADHPRNIFGQAIYRPGARLWLHEDLARVVLLAARTLQDRAGWSLELKDGLRPVEAQQAMQQTAIVQANPHWYEPGPRRLLSPPGQGAHPRGMAIDVCVRGPDGGEIDMGTPFDYLTEDRENNPAARAYRDLPEEILTRRALLETAFTDAGERLSLPVVPLPSEWWDFRFPPETYNLYAPVHDSHYPPWMRMTGASGSTDGEMLFDKKARDILNSLDGYL